MEYSLNLAYNEFSDAEEAADQHGIRLEHPKDMKQWNELGWTECE